ncbi:TonB-dependent receptor [bacterium]|nr:TonB-dependent receptor [bacterium]
MRWIQFIFLSCLLTSSLYCSANTTTFGDTAYVFTSTTIEDLQKRNYNDFGDMVSHLPGTWIRNMGSIGQWSSVGMCGSNDNQVVILLDGRPLFDVWSGSNDLNMIPEEMIERIEIFPTVNPFGLNPTGGAMNLVSKSNVSNQPYTKIVYRTGKDHFSDLDITFSQQLTSKLHIISGVLLKKYGDLLPNKKYEGQTIRSKINYHFSQNGELLYSILNNKSDLDIPYGNTIPGDTLFLESSHRKRIRYDHTLQTQFDLRNTHIQLRLEHTSLHYELRRNFNPQVSFPIQQTGLYAHQQFLIMNIPLCWSIYTVRRELKNDLAQKWVDTMTQGFIQGTVHFTSNSAILFQIHSHISPDKKNRLFLAGQLSWELSNAFMFFSNYLEGIRDPSLGERFGFPFYPDISQTENQLMMRNISTQILPNPSLKPETSQTIEIGFLWRLKNGITISSQGHLRSTKDLIEGTPIEDHYWFDNRTRVSFRGICTQINMGPYHGFQANVIGNLLNATDADGKALLERPRMWGNGSVSYNHNFFQDDLNVYLCFSTRFVSGYWKLIGDTIDDRDHINLISTDPISIIDFKVICTFLQRMKLSFAIDNIIGTNAALISEYPLMKKMIRFGISWEMLN